MAKNDTVKKVKKGNAKVPFSPLGPTTAKNTNSKLTDPQLNQVMNYHNRNNKNNPGVDTARLAVLIKYNLYW